MADRWRAPIVCTHGFVYLALTAGGGPPRERAPGGPQASARRGHKEQRTHAAQGMTGAHVRAASLARAAHNCA